MAGAMIGGLLNSHARRREVDHRQRSARDRTKDLENAVRHHDDDRKPRRGAAGRYRHPVGEAADAAVRVSRPLRQAAQGRPGAVDHRWRAHRLDDSGAEAPVDRPLDAEHARAGGRRHDRLDGERRPSPRPSASRRSRFCSRSAKSSTWPMRRFSTWRRRSAAQGRAMCSSSWKR